MDKTIPKRQKVLLLLNVFGFTYFLVMVTSVTCVAFLDVIPSLSESHKWTKELHYFFAIYLFINIIGNFVNVMRTDSSVNLLFDKNQETPTLQTNIKLLYEELDFKKIYCKICRIHVPPRCHHCVLCNCCILKRDHHCFFMCSCVGYYNQKYFILFCFWQSVAAGYCAHAAGLYMESKYLLDYSGPWSLVTLIPRSIYRW